MILCVCSTNTPTWQRIAVALGEYVVCANFHQHQRALTMFVRCIFRHDGGSFDMAIFNVDLTSVVTLGKDPDGHLSVTSVSCDAQVGDVDVQFHGGARYSRTEGERDKRKDTDVKI